MFPRITNIRNDKQLNQNEQHINSGKLNENGIRNQAQNTKSVNTSVVAKNDLVQNQYKPMSSPRMGKAENNVLSDMTGAVM